MEAPAPTWATGTSPSRGPRSSTGPRTPVETTKGALSRVAPGARDRGQNPSPRAQLSPSPRTRTGGRHRGGRGGLGTGQAPTRADHRVVSRGRGPAARPAFPTPARSEVHSSLHLVGLAPGRGARHPCSAPHRRRDDSSAPAARRQPPFAARTVALHTFSAHPLVSGRRATGSPRASAPAVCGPARRRETRPRPPRPVRARPTPSGTAPGFALAPAEGPHLRPPTGPATLPRDASRAPQGLGIVSAPRRRRGWVKAGASRGAPPRPAPSQREAPQSPSIAPTGNATLVPPLRPPGPSPRGH